jgi:hypothetical protein
MAWFIGLSLLVLLCLIGLALLGHHRAKVGDLLAVIRAQRRRVDGLEAELLGRVRKGGGPACGRDHPSRPARKAGSSPGLGPLFGGYPIKPSAN